MTQTFDMELARKAREKAYTPHSGHAVGAVLFTESDEYFGANIEVSGRVTSTHAEMMAAFRAVLAGDMNWDWMTVTERPCAVCAHTLAEWANADFEVRMPGETMTLDGLLGESYRPGNHDGVLD